MSNESAYHGYRYLLDAKNGRQYAIRFTNGKVEKPIHVFANRVEDAPNFKPNETVYAFDDESTVEIVGGKAFVSAVLYQISTDATGAPKNLKYIGVSYRVGGDPARGISYTLTEESLQSLRNKGFDLAELPESFQVSLKDAGMDDVQIDRQGRLVIDPSELRGVAFPPHQDRQAFVARHNISQLSDNNTPSTYTPAPSHTEKARPQQQTNRGPMDNNKPRDNFNRSSSYKPATKRYRVPDAAIEQVLRQFTQDLTEQAENGTLDPVIGRDGETEQALRVLTRRKQSSLCFTGDAGVGKTAMFSAVAQRLVDDEANLPESLQGARVMLLDLQAMNAGAKYRGQFEEKLKPLIDGLQEREGVLNGRKIILAIDEIHSQLTAGKAEGGSDSGNMMKPFLTARGISVMGTTTDAEYKKHIEVDGALGRRFEKMNIASTKEEDTVQVLKALWPLTREHNGLTEDMSDDDFRYIVTMSDRYAPQESQPSKAEKVMNMAAAGAEFAHRSKIERSDVINAIAQMANLPVEFLAQKDHERFLKLEEALPNEVLGQPGLSRIVDGLIGSRSGLTDENQPWGCFVLQGPTGTGKTETCKALARYLFGTEDALIKIDMSEYSEKHAVSRLIGAPPGYVGYDSAEPALTEKIRKRPYSILLLDEIEKAHPDVFNVLLPVLNDGKMTDNQGKVALFNNVIVVMTTNAGAAQATAVLEGGNGISFALPNSEKTAEKTEDELARIYRKAIMEPLTPGAPALFRPEMVNRIEELGGFIIFRPLAREVVSTLAIREIEKVNKRLNSRAGAGIEGLTLTVTEEVKEKLASEGYNPAFGARPLRRVIREKIANPFGKWLMSNRAMVDAFIAQNGPAKLVIDTLDTFAPTLVKDEVFVAKEAVRKIDGVSNDNGAVKGKRIPTTKQRKSNGGPKI